MSKPTTLWLVALFASSTAFAAGSAFAAGEDHRHVIKGWMVDGPLPQLTDYDGGIDKGVSHSGTASAFLRSIVPQPKAHAVVAQQLSATHYRGQRVRLSAWVRTRDVVGEAGMWLKVLKHGSHNAYAYDRKSVHGSSEWQREDIVVDVAPDAETLYFGLGLEGTGQSWVDDAKLEIVDRSVPTTDQLQAALSLKNGSFED